MCENVLYRRRYVSVSSLFSQRIASFGFSVILSLAAAQRYRVGASTVVIRPVGRSSWLVGFG